MAMPKENINTILKNPHMYPVAFDGDSCCFVRMDREQFQNSIFTDPPRIKSVNNESFVVQTSALLDRFLRNKKKSIDCHFIFHTANCGSTLLSRALDYPGVTIGYREPFTLRQLGVEHNRFQNTGGDLERLWSDKLSLILHLLSRRFSSHEKPLVKANIPVNFILEEIFSRSKQSKGIFLYATLEDFLISSLKIEQRRNWVATVISQLKDAIFSMPVLSGMSIGSLSIEKLSALLWVVQIIKYQDAINQSLQIKSINSDLFFKQPLEILDAVSGYFGLGITSEMNETTISSGLFSAYSKNPNFHFDEAMRESIRSRALLKFNREIQEGLEWGGELLIKNGYSIEIPNSLI